MSLYRFIYQKYECNRIVPATLIDNRRNIPEINGKAGLFVKSYTDTKTDEIIGNDLILFYKIETIDSYFVGYLSLLVSDFQLSASQDSLVIRPNWADFQPQIQAEIFIFIQSGEWKQDYLY